MPSWTRAEAPGRSYVHTWGSLTTGDATGDSVEMPGAADRSVQIVGTFSTATVTVQGSNDGTNWFPLTDPQGNNIAKTADALEQIMETVRYIRPVATSADGSTDVVVVLFSRSTMR